MLVGFKFFYPRSLFRITRGERGKKHLRKRGYGELKFLYLNPKRKNFFFLHSYEVGRKSKKENFPEKLTKFETD